MMSVAFHYVKWTWPKTFLRDIFFTWITCDAMWSHFASGWSRLQLQYVLQPLATGNKNFQTFRLLRHDAFNDFAVFIYTICVFQMFSVIIKKCNFSLYSDPCWELCCCDWMTALTIQLLIVITGWLMSEAFHIALSWLSMDHIRSSLSCLCQVSPLLDLYERMKGTVGYKSCSSKISDRQFIIWRLILIWSVCQGCC